MQANRIIPLLITIFFFAFSRVTAQCFPINGNIDIYDLDSQPNSVLTLTGSTDGAENTFAIPGGTLDGLQFPAPDIIYEMVVEPGDTFNIFIDLCPGTNFDASIGIIHRENLTNCLDVTDEAIVGWGDYEFFGEWRDANGLCPDSDYGEIAPGNDGFVPLARDVYLEPGTYYIVVDGDNDGAVGNFTMVIGEMLEFDGYSLHEQNQYVDISFTSPVYGVSDDATWELGPPTTGQPPSVSDYFEFTEENGQPIQTGTVTQTNGQPLQNNPYPGYDELRFPLINLPPDVSIIFLAPKEHNFNGAIVPRAVNLSGVPFNDNYEMEIEMNELSAPEIEGLSSLSEDNSSARVTFSEGVYSNNNETGGVASVHFTIESVGADLSPSIVSITDTSGTLIPTGGEEILKFNLSMANSSGSESIRIRAQENAVFSSSGIALAPQWSTLLDLNDLLPPEVSYSFSPDSTNAGVNPGAEIKIVFDDSVYFKGDVDIEPGAIGDVISLNYEIDGILDAAISFDATINTDKDTITIIPDDSLTQVKRVRVTVLGDTLVDSNENPMTEKLFRFTVADIVIPKINDYSLTANNKYVLINFSENLWSETDQSGDIVPSDFVIELNSDHENSNATVATIEGVTDGEGNTLELQNIDAIRLYLEIDPDPSGVESITIAPASGEIFDQGNNPLLLTGNSMSFNLSDQLGPSITIKSNSSSDDIGFIHPGASFVATSIEPLQKVLFTDATCQVTSGSATVTHEANGNIVAGIIVSGTGIPPGATIESITNATSFELSDNATSGDGSEISLTFSEPITDNTIEDYITLQYLPDLQEITYTAKVNETKTSIEIIPDSNDVTCQVTSGSATVTHAANVSIVAGIIVSGTGIPSGATIKSITNATSFELSDNATSGDGSDISLTFGTLIEWREVKVKIDSQNDDGDSIIDAAGNSIEMEEVIIRVDDITVPTIDNAIIDDTNTYITLTMSEPVYNIYNQDGGVGGLSDSHFELSIEENDLNNAQNIDIENVTGLDEIPLEGGETEIEIEIMLSRVDASGSEIVTVSPTERPIHDQAGNGVSIFLNQKTVTLYDMLSPTVSFSPPANTPILPNTDFSLTFSESIKTYDTGDNIIDIDPSIVNSLELLIDQTGAPIAYETSLNFDSTIITLTPNDDLNETETYTLSFAAMVFCDESGNSVPLQIAQYTVSDIRAPTFDSDTLGSGNQYVQINMSEGVYTESSGTGGLTSDDFELVEYYGDGAGAELISIDYLSNITGGELSGGEETVLVNLNIIGSTNGTEQVRVHAVSGEIFDGSGNSMSVNESTTEYPLWAAPVFNNLNSSLSTDNSYVTLIFDQGPVFTNAALNQPVKKQDFVAELARPGENITQVQIDSVLDTSGNPLDDSGANSIRLYFNLGFMSDGSDTIIFSPASPTAIYNQYGVNMDTSQQTRPFNLYDQLPPTYSLSVQDGALNIDNNETIIVSFNEPVQMLGEQALTPENAEENFIISDVTDDENIIELGCYTMLNSPAPDSIWVIMNNPFGSEHVISFTIEDAFEDTSRNQVEEGSTIFFTARDNVYPGFVSGSAVIDEEAIEYAREFPSEGNRDVCYVELSINDDVFTDPDASLPVQASDFSVGIIQNGGSVSSGTVEDIDLLEPDIIGKDSLRFTIKFDTVPSGDESLFIHATDSTVFDNGFNAMSPDSTSDTLSLYDLRFPTIDSTSIKHNGYVDLYSDSTIVVYFSEPIKPESFDYSFIAEIDTIDFSYQEDLTEEYLTISLNRPILSYDIFVLAINHLEDISGNMRDTLIVRRFKTKVAGDFHPEDEPDDRVGPGDANKFIIGWNSRDYSKNLGPYEGTPPNIKITQDNLFGIDDGMAFTQMWLWSLQTFGPSLVVQEQLVNLPSSILYSDNTISIMPPDSALSGQVMINYDVTDYQIHPGDNNELKNNGILLGNNNDQKGISLIEYALHKNNRSAVSFDVNNKDQASSEIKVSYSFFDEDFRLISKGDSILHSIALPTEFTLMQNYPNPFNPSTTIRFTIPSNSFVRLIVYDITGKVVNEIVNGFLEPGVHNVEWSGTDAGGIDVSSGLYFYRIEASNYSKTYKMVFVK